IARAHRDGTQGAILSIDLDRFKDVVDSLGHAVGDDLLCVTAQRLQSCLCEGDSVARLGGDEFAVSLSGVRSSREAALSVERVLEALRRPYLVGQQELHVGGSIGVSLYPADGDGAQALLRAADTAMY